MEQPPMIVKPEPRPSAIPFWLAVGANAATFLFSIRLYFIPSGTRIRPMGWAFAVGCIAVIGFVALLMTLPVARKRQYRFRMCLTVVLAVTPFPLARAMLYHAAHIHNLFLEP
jgi:hypothetical protein